MERYDTEYKREINATYFGIALLAISIIMIIIAAAFIPADMHLDPKKIGKIIAAPNFIIRVFAAYWVSNIAERQGRNKTIWTGLAFGFPSLALILIGLSRRLNPYRFDKNVNSTATSTIIVQAPKEYKLEINRACNSDGLIGFVDKNGEILIPYQYTGAEEFSEGLAVVYFKGEPLDKYGFIDTNGKLVIPAQFEFAESFSEGLAVVRKNKLFGFINKEGQIIIDCLLENASSFNNGKAEVVLGGNTYFINPKGEDA